MLVALARAGEGYSSYGTLSDATHRSHRAIQYAIRELERLGLIRIERCGTDRRRSVIALSAMGRAAFAEYRERLALRIRSLTGEAERTDSAPARP